MADPLQLPKPALPAGLPTAQELNTMPLGEDTSAPGQPYGTGIRGLRNTPAFAGQAAQNYLAPYDHQAFVRQQTAAAPIQGALYTALSPVYDTLKAAGLQAATGRSQPQLATNALASGTGFIQGLPSVPNVLNAARSFVSNPSGGVTGVVAGEAARELQPAVSQAKNYITGLFR